MLYQSSRLPLCQILLLLVLSPGDALGTESTVGKGLLSNAIKRAAQAADSHAQGADEKREVLAMLTKSQGEQIGATLEALKLQQQEERAIADELRHKERILNRKAAELQLREDALAQGHHQEAVQNLGQPQKKEDELTNVENFAQALKAKATQLRAVEQRMKEVQKQESDLKAQQLEAKDTENQVMLWKKRLQAQRRYDEAAEKVALATKQREQNLRSPEEIEDFRSLKSLYDSTMKASKQAGDSGSQSGKHQNDGSKHEFTSHFGKHQDEGAMHQHSSDLSGSSEARFGPPQDGPQTKLSTAGTVQGKKEELDEKKEELVKTQRQAVAIATKEEDAAAMKFKTAEYERIQADQHAAEQFIYEIESRKRGIAAVTKAELDAFKSSNARNVAAPMASVDNELKALAQAREELGRRLEENALRLQSAQAEKTQIDRKAAEHYAAEVQKKNQELQATKDNLKQEATRQALVKSNASGGVTQDAEDPIQRVPQHEMQAQATQQASVKSNANGGVTQDAEDPIQRVPQHETQAQVTEVREAAAKLMPQLEIVPQPLTESEAGFNTIKWKKLPVTVLDQESVQLVESKKAKADAIQAKDAMEKTAKEQQSRAKTSSSVTRGFLQRTWQPNVLPQMEDPPHREQLGMTEMQAIRGHDLGQLSVEDQDQEIQRQVEALSRKREELHHLKQMQDAMMAYNGI